MNNNIGYPAQQASGQNNSANYDRQQVPSRLSNIASNLESLNCELGSVIERLIRLADRLNGAVPQEASKEAGSLRGSGGGLITVMETHLENSSGLFNRLRNVLERLETL